MRGKILKILMAACLATACAFATAQTTEKAERLVEQIRVIKNPPFDPAKSGDAEYVKQHREATKQAIRQRGTLIIALFREDPESYPLTEFLPQRWMELEQLADNEAELAAVLLVGIKETEDLLLPPYNIPPATIWPDDSWHQMCRYWRGRMVIRMNQGNWPAQIAVVKDYIQETPSFPATHTDLLLQAAFQAPSPLQAAEAYKMIVDKYPLDPIIPVVKGFLRRIDGVGQPISFTFLDPKTKKEVKTELFKGKVVVVDFFRLDPEKMNPRIQALRDLKAAHAKDLVIISVCVDSAKGAEAKILQDKVLNWAAEQNIDWLVAVPGEKAQADFRQAWHLTALPEAFFINKEGVLKKLGFGLNLKVEAEALLKS
jgi:hypothetical protein